MSFEAIFYARKLGAISEFYRKWLTVPTDDRAAAIKAFHDTGFETRGGTILTQQEATALAEKEAAHASDARPLGLRSRH
jgi:hypothetical protein